MKRLFWAAMGVALISMVFAGCKKETTYTVQVTATKGGTVEGQNGEYKEGETVVFTAVPADGYYFSHWSDRKDDNPRTIIVSTRNISITAQFIGVSPIEGGTIETQGSGRIIDMNNGFESYSSIDITAFPADGYCFSQWSDGNTDNPRKLLEDLDDVATDITAEFVLPTITTVDLGLTSGNLWATCNIGTINPWNIGSYYAWGETQIKNNYSWENYKYCNGTSESLTKYNVWAEYGTVDKKKTLEPADDVATAIFGAEYSIPTYDDWQELIDECYWVLTRNYNNHYVGGYIVYRAKTDADKGVKTDVDGTSALYSLSDAHIFLPEACQRIDMSGAYLDFGGSYWSASLYTNEPYYACSLRDYKEGPTWVSSRCNGQSVRPIRRP